jgi:excisionase family DNA binding protein
MTSSPPPRRPPAAPPLLTVRATAERLQVAEKTVRRLVAAGELPTHRIGGCVRVSEVDLQVFLARARR